MERNVFEHWFTKQEEASNVRLGSTYGDGSVDMMSSHAPLLLRSGSRSGQERVQFPEVSTEQDPMERVNLTTQVPHGLAYSWWPLARQRQKYCVNLQPVLQRRDYHAHP